MSDQYDNTNRGSLWRVDGPASSGPVNLDGDDWHGTLVRNRSRNDRAPSHELWLRSKNGELDYAPLWPPKKEGSKALLSGSTQTHWVHIFRNDSDNPNAPQLSVKVSPKEDAPPPSTSSIDEQDDLPI